MTSRPPTLWRSLLVIWLLIGLGGLASGWSLGRAIRQPPHLSQDAVSRGALPDGISVESAIARMQRSIWVIVAITTVGTATALSGLLVIEYRRRVTLPMRRLGAEVTRLSGRVLGDPREFHTTPGPYHLAQTLADLNRRISERIEAASTEARQQRAAITSMVESVITVDTDERIIGLNPAAATLLRAAPDHAHGRSIYEVIRNTELQRFVGRSLQSDTSVEDNLTFRVVDDEFLLQAQGSVLRDDRGDRVGAVIVLHDVTRLQVLESVRSDFVANVSHELKTPISAIKAASETIIEIDRNKGEDPEAQRFLAMIARQADRLAAIVEDLLSLARIEQENRDDSFSLECHPIEPVMEAAVQTCQARAHHKGIELTLSAEDGLSANINRRFLEQAIVNLIDNAIKYSPERAPVTFSAGRGEDDIVITVKDRGCGITPEHIPRLFERFYRVDKARSSDLGGTGLGLAIVKHIVQGHGGHVTVHSTTGDLPSRGSEFAIHLPVVEVG